MKKQAAKVTPRPGDVWTYRTRRYNIWARRLIVDVDAVRVVYRDKIGGQIRSVKLPTFRKWVERTEAHKESDSGSVYCPICGRERLLVDGWLSCWNRCGPLVRPSGDVDEKLRIVAKPIKRMLAMMPRGGMFPDAIPKPAEVRGTIDTTGA